jgi:hypothetical protein
MHTKTRRYSTWKPVSVHEYLFTFLKISIVDYAVAIAVTRTNFVENKIVAIEVIYRTGSKVRPGAANQQQTSTK